MNVARHPRDPELEGVSLEEIADKYIARFNERYADWEAFEDAKIEGWKRAQQVWVIMPWPPVGLVMACRRPGCPFHDLSQWDDHAPMADHHELSLYCAGDTDAVWWW